MNILVVIPARGGSKGIPKKNIRFMNGKPLIAYAIENALHIKGAKVVVTSDSEEILELSEKYGAQPLNRPKELSGDNITLDPVIENAVAQMEKITNDIYNVVITMQPTSPLLAWPTLNDAISYFINGDYDTVISAVNMPHLSWKKKDGRYIPNYKERLNRQYLPENFVETGAFVITKREFITKNSRLGLNISIYEVPEKEAIDIDTYQDWCIAETELKRKKIFIHVAGYRQIGTGHIYRCLQLAFSMSEHEINFIVQEQSDLAIKIIINSNYPITVAKNENDVLRIIKEKNVDIIINDVLDTNVTFMKQLKETGIRIINFEDLGPGSQYADAVINDIYDKRIEGKQYYWGSDFFIIRDEFHIETAKNFSKEVENILVLFGGTDPNDLTQKTLKALKAVLVENKIQCTIILGLGYEKQDEIEQEIRNNGYKNVKILRNVRQMSKYMKEADIAISSCGRTMYELACMGVPTILLAQNTRETEHTFGGLANGYLNLGLGKNVEEETLKNTIQWLIKCPMIRKEMRKCLLKIRLKNGLKNVKKIIIGTE